MVTFKFTAGRKEGTYDITEENFETHSAGSDRYISVSDDGTKRYHAICPFCDNPIIIHGFYTRTKVSEKPYGSHYPFDVNEFVYNPLTKEHCPAYTGRRTSAKTDRYKDMQPLNREIYNSMRENFSSVVYILSQELGIKIGYELAENLLLDYLGSEGYKYYDAGIYNIPWMLLYMSHISVPLYKRLVTADSPLYGFLRERSDVRLIPIKNNNSKYYQIEKTGKYLDLRIDFALHNRKETKGVLDETIVLRAITRDWNKIIACTKENKPVYGDKVIYKYTISINEKRYPNLVNSNRKRTDAELDKIAKRLMPLLEETNADPGKSIR